MLGGAGLQPALHLADGTTQTTTHRNRNSLLVGGLFFLWVGFVPWAVAFVPNSRAGRRVEQHVPSLTAGQEPRPMAADSGSGSEQQLSHSSNATRLAETILYVGRSGFVSEEGRKVLGGLWRDLDPEMSLLPRVTEELNRRYAQQYRDYLNTWSMLGDFACVFCWEFSVTESSVRHFLDGNDVPEARVVKWFGLDIGATLARLVCLGEGGEARGRFQVRVLASLPKSPSWGDVRVFGHHFFTLYTTLIVAHYAPAVVCLTTVSWIIGIEGMQQFTQEGMSIRQRCKQAALTAYRRLVQEPGSTALAVLGFLWVVAALGAWREVMMPRVALLTTSIHMSLLEQGYLLQGDSLDFCEHPLAQASLSFLEACRRTAILRLPAAA